MNCAPCGKFFTGEVCYQQHLHSEKHKKKVKLEHIETFIPVKSDNALKLPLTTELILCDICKISFEGLQNYKKHVDSLEHHQIMVKRFGNRNSSAKEVPISCKANASYFDSDTNLIEMNDDDKIINMQECVNQKLYYKRCDICKKNFSGPEPFQQHLVSNGHMKKLALNSNGSIVAASHSGCITSENSRVATTPSISTNILICEVCDKTFTGPVPYEMHLNSEVHKKKLNNKALLEQYRSIDQNAFNSNVIDSTTREEENHLRGADYNNSKIIDEIDTTNASFNLLNQLKEKNSDSILSDHTNLDIITADQLNIKFFPVNSEINFDKHIESSVLPYEANEVDENKIETETTITKKCNLCDVFFKDMDDLIKHYESREHFLKKWCN